MKHYKARDADPFYTGTNWNPSSVSGVGEMSGLTAISVSLTDLYLTLPALGDNIDLFGCSLKSEDVLR